MVCSIGWLQTKLKVSIKYGMGCQKISSGMMYGYSKGHKFIIVGISNSTIEVVVYSNARQSWYVADNRGRGKNCEWPNLFEGSLKVWSLMQFWI